MSVLIRGMEMPKSCGYCPLRHEARDGDECYLGASLTEYQKRPDDCLLVPVPPHGIIDREQILDAIRLELAQSNAVNDMDDYDEWIRVFDYVRKFPTIIPADEVV